MINTLEIKERLVLGGFNEQQSKAIAEELFQRSLDSDLVTKSDLINAMSKLKDQLTTWLLVLIGMIFVTYALIIGMYVQIGGQLNGIIHALQK